MTGQVQPSPLDPGPPMECMARTWSSEGRGGSRPQFSCKDGNMGRVSGLQGGDSGLWVVLEGPSKRDTGLEIGTMQPRKGQLSPAWGHPSLHLMAGPPFLPDWPLEKVCEDQGSGQLLWSPCSEPGASCGIPWRRQVGSLQERMLLGPQHCLPAPGLPPGLSAHNPLAGRAGGWCAGGPEGDSAGAACQ